MPEYEDQIICFISVILWCLQMLASLKQQYVELLSDIGFIQSGIRLRDVERAGKIYASDGVAEITGLEVSYC